MSLVERLREQSNKIEATKQEVIEEIKTYFDNYFKNSNNLEGFVERISPNYIKDKEIPIITDFWEYHSGCSGTHFSCGGCWWYPNNDKYSSKSYYKGVYLRDIQYEICEYLKVRVKEEMIKLGFIFKTERYDKSNLGYFDNTMYFGW